jgi:peptidoglycan/LPS O-acetylase OafA/YrhL
MSEWWTYTLADIKSFTLQTYYRLFELHNRAIWPAQLVAVALGLAILALLRRPDVRRGKVIAAILAACWLFVAVAFHAHRYATLTWSARYYAWAFGVEAVLLLWIGVIRGRLSFERRAAGVAIYLFALIAHPLIEPLLGRRWSEVEVFGVAPDPTAIATLGLLLLAAGRVRWELAAIPLLWCAISGATLLSMKVPDAGIPLTAGVLAAILSARRTLARRWNLEASWPRT